MTRNHTLMVNAIADLPDYTDEVYRETLAVKLFTPDANATWFLAQRNADATYTFGLCDLGLGMAELGYVYMPEIYELKGVLGLPVEFDEYWNGTMADGYKALNLDVPSWLKSAKQGDG